MSIIIQYGADRRMQLGGLSCDCDCAHETPDQDIYVGSDLISQIPEFIRARGLGERCLVVMDENTRRVAGARVHESLRASGFHADALTFARAGELVPDETTVGELLLHVLPETQFLVAVGSGTITDACRVVAARCKLPFVSVATAASMDGYTSVVAPLLLNGVKIHRDGPCPEIIVCDLAALATAPIDMVRAGVGDVLGKYIAIADWQIGRIINNEPFCPVCAEMVLSAVDSVLEHIDEIKDRTARGMQLLIEALLIAGLTILIVGHTRAVASVEHNISHFVEMKMLERFSKAPAHGETVGVATRLVYPIFKEFAASDLSGVDVHALRPMPEDARRAWMLHAYGEIAANAIMDENPGDFLTTEELHRRAQRAIARFDEIRAVIDRMPPLEAIEQAMDRLGALRTMAELGVEIGIERMAMHAAKDYRTRYTLFKTIDELGLSDKFLGDHPIG
ncbi:MAG: sn-glycerol-1-phosphate dehydrogenase [Christensenellales bacterium]|jgi:glycerol-1-phosphate dehydrogenase [NAD(P)+]